ncbi:polysaccharide deacetylase family protein [Solidesulfovibrio sp.]|uniref:polysaccharide deacetylase family protein n=1 Tax=Solidesulfovibrio sp. TaxID=2910990 RepID=UPI002602F846|nr:polysaccharide deacetylase family protein [Solidesulfovibrio sp.]
MKHAVPSLALALCLAACLVPARGTAGSRAVFEAVSDAATRQVDAAEKKSGRVSAPDRSPPEATAAPELPPLPPSQTGSIRRVDTHGVKLVALTFDLCELADQVSGYDGAVVEALRAAGAKATFFAGGKWMRSHPRRAMELMADPLFEVGSHAWTHGNFGRLDDAGMVREIAWAQAEYALLRERLARLAREKGVSEADIAAIPPAPTIFRFPYGRCRPEALSLLAAMGIRAVQWSLTVGDPDPAATPARILENVLPRVRPGDIVVGHANGFGHGTGEALPRLLAALSGQGYRFVTISELLAAGRAVASSDCYDSHPGDTARYDAIFGDGTLHPHRVKGSGEKPPAAKGLSPSGLP